MFDDCKGEKLQELLASFSTLVLRKVLVNGHEGKASIASRLATAKRVTPKEHASFLPLAIAHRASLTAILRKKSELRARYANFGKVLSKKEQELDERFEAIVQTQEFLDKNSIPDHTVSRVTKLFEKHWQADAKLVEAIVKGEGQTVKDPLLDEEFEQTWQRVSNGEFEGPSKVGSHGVLEDLERRVASQEARLNQWKEFKEAMKTDDKPLSDQKIHSPVLVRAKSINPDLQKQRDLVFSPRKSPRKSDLVMQDNGNQITQLPFTPTSTNINEDFSYSDPLKGDPNRPLNDEANGQDSGWRGKRHVDISPHHSPLDDGDQSGFSEISDGHLHYMEPPKDTGRPHNLSPSPTYVNQDASDRMERESHNSMAGRTLDTSNGNDKSNGVDEDELLANQIVSMTLNAAPTPAKPKLSLVERTRQSIIASSSPSKLHQSTAEGSSSPPPSLPVATEDEKSSNEYRPGMTTLLERTRNSITHLPSKGHRSRQSIPHNRRTSSKLYPTNQFETPRKQMQEIKELKTPPEELFSPGAGYDSVFKSRPKVGFSPVASPAYDSSPLPDDASGLPGNVDEGLKKLAGDNSPLARVAART